MQDKPINIQAATRLMAAKYSGFAWYVWHRDTKYIIAGFNEHSDANRFVKSFPHDKYEAVPSNVALAYHDH